MPYKLIIVESPVKANTIEKYLGTNYKVTSCNGHVRDLPKKELAIDIKNQFKPTYIPYPGKENLISQLKKQAKQAIEVLLATDDDREGEAISWHLQQILNLSQTKTKRIFFREITKKALLHALANPRKIDLNKVNAQQARRILDRLVGYDISPILWKKIKMGLSAGRVQSVAVKLIVQQERAIRNFTPTAHFKVTADLSLPDQTPLQAELKTLIQDEKKAEKLLKDCIQADFTIKDIKKTTLNKSPAKPFTTVTLQQEASNKLGFSVKKTMTVAQELYEKGHISYMRTDATHLAEEALQSAKQTIINTYGPQYHTRRTYTTQSATAQQAHEAIRPTHFERKELTNEPHLQSLYRLIWQRTIASQMTDATVHKTKILINISSSNQTLVTQAEHTSFKGFLAAYNQQSTDDPNFSQLKVGQRLRLQYMQAKQTLTQPPSRYTEASLVKRLEQEGIGRPSTYAPTISTIQQRGYITKESREGTTYKYPIITLQKGIIEKKIEEGRLGHAKNKLFPTDVACIVNDFLNLHFQPIINYKFTAQIEEELDDIAQNKKDWKAMLHTFYQQFAPQVNQASTSDQEVKTVYQLGNDPKTGKPVIARLSRRYGPLVQIGAMDSEEKPRFASLPKDCFLEQITLEKALKLFKLPRELNLFENHPITVQVGRYGPYLKHKNKCYALSKYLDPYTVSHEQATSLITALRQQEAKKIIKTFQNHNPIIQICRGRWGGAYIKLPGSNIKVPKEQDPEKLNLEACKAIISQAQQEKKGKKIKKRFTKKT